MLAPCAQADRQPNFVYILADDLGVGDVGVYGQQLLKTPRIDQLAAEGMRFTDGYVASPMCSPTRASIMTGKHPARLHMTNWIGAPQPEAYKWNTILRSAPYEEAMRLDEVTVAESLQKAGYETAIFGKWHLGKDEKYWPENQGFETNVGACAWGAPIGGDLYTIDLNGFTLRGVPGSLDGISTGARCNVSNGAADQWGGNGIQVGEGTIHNVTAIGNGQAHHLYW